MFEKELEIAIKAAKAAGQIILEGYTRENQINIKENKSQVTEVDKNCEAEIISILESESSYKIMAEETRFEDLYEDMYWAVDPLDGTTNFIRRIPLFGTSIALMRKGSPVVGVVFNPATDELFAASEGNGVKLNGKSIRCSIESDVVLATSGYELEQKKKISEFLMNASRFTPRKLGTSAYELCCVAKGSADGYVSWGDQLWDHAAGIVIVREAGGRVTDWDGNEWSHPGNYLIASNRAIHSELLEIVIKIK